MARRRARTRARSGGPGVSAIRTASKGGRAGERTEASMVPRVLLGAVSGVELVAGSALQLTRDVLVSAVSGAASIGAEALTATVGGARGVVSAASRMVGDIAGTAQGTLQEALASARGSRLGAARRGLRRPPARMAGRSGEAMTGVPSAGEPRSRARARRRPAARHARSRTAA
jgi:hypothetical protein